MDPNQNPEGQNFTGGQSTTPPVSPTPVAGGVAGDLGAEKLSTGANVSRAMNSLNQSSPIMSAGAARMTKKRFDHVEANGDIIIHNDVVKQPSPFDKLKTIPKKTWAIIAGTLAAIILLSVALLALSAKPAEKVAKVDVAEKFNDFYNYLQFGDEPPVENTETAEDVENTETAETAEDTETTENADTNFIYAIRVRNQNRDKIAEYYANLNTKFNEFYEAATNYPDREDLEQLKEAIVALDRSINVDAMRRQIVDMLNENDLSTIETFISDIAYDFPVLKPVERDQQSYYSEFAEWHAKYVEANCYNSDSNYYDEECYASKANIQIGTDEGANTAYLARDAHLQVLQLATRNLCEKIAQNIGSKK